MSQPLKERKREKEREGERERATEGCPGVVCPYQLTNRRQVESCTERYGSQFKKQLLSRNVQRSRGGLVFEAPRLLYHSTLGSREIKQKRRVKMTNIRVGRRSCIDANAQLILVFTATGNLHVGCRVWGVGCRV